jgi:hypothetical protein
VTSEGFFFSTIHIMMAVAAEREYLMRNDLTRSFGRIGIGIQRPGRAYSPCKNVLRMIVPKIDFCRPANWYAFCLSVVRSEEVRS